jgi:LmbE family N-acetylglucosaminyl deacetylase
LKFGPAVAGLIAFSFLAASSTPAQFPPAPGTGPGLAETIEAIDSARVTTRILYITAHPDDESGAVLTYLARGLHADVALLSITHGEGGQNALGPEQAPQLGLIRTQELLAATRGYGVKLYFTRAKDFGFSKTPEETEKIWGDEVLEDMVRIIRTFRPNIVINNFGGVHTGHGHHQTSGLWTPKAVALASDPSYKLPEEANLAAREPSVWDGGISPIRVLDVDRFSDTPKGLVLPVDDVSPLWGKSWREIGIDAFSNHRTQGITAFLGSPFLRRPVALRAEDDKPVALSDLAQPLESLSKNPGLVACWSADGILSMAKSADVALARAKAEALTLHWAEATTSLVAAARDVGGPISRNYQPPNCTSGSLAEFVGLQEHVNRALQLAAGLQLNVTSDQGLVAAGDSFKISGTYRCRAYVACHFDSNGLQLPSGVERLSRDQKPGGESLTARASNQTSSPSRFQAIRPVGEDSLAINTTVEIGGYLFNVEAPIMHLAATSTRIDLVPLRIVPTYTLSVDPKQDIEVLAKQRKPFDVLLRVHSYSTQPGKVSAGLDVPQGWTSSAPTLLNFPGTGDLYVKLTVTPPNKLVAGNYTITAYAKRGDEKFSTSLEALPSMPTILWSEPAECRVHAFNVSVPENLRVGYITSEGEPVPEALQRLGIHVEMLDAAALNFSDLSKFDAIVVGVRAYELRPELPGANQRLLDYASNGGTLVVQYQRDFAWDKFQFAPYPAKIDPGKPGAPLPRITDETSPVKFLKPDDPLLNKPNKITRNDFEGWVQERGLYFWSQFDDKYTPLLAMNDPGEPDLNGGLVYARYGKGTYIYTGIAFFRQLPEGVPGAYRIFVNLLSASRNR